MIRRGFWLATGAVLGVTGYRKAARLGRELTGQSRRSAGPVPGGSGMLTGSALPLLPGPGTARRQRGTLTSVLTGAASAAGFVRDVREGMAEYWDLHRGDLARSLGTRTDLTGPDARQADRDS